MEKPGCQCEARHARGARRRLYRLTPLRVGRSSLKKHGEEAESVRTMARSQHVNLIVRDDFFRAF